MVQKGKEKIKPPAYPQVVTLQEIRTTVIKCRFCKKRMDNFLAHELDEEARSAIRSGGFRKIDHECGNTVKVINGR